MRKTCSSRVAAWLLFVFVSLSSPMIPQALALTEHRTVAKAYTKTFPPGVNTFFGVTATCPVGWYATGGGFDKDGTANLTVYVLANKPAGTRSWYLGLVRGSGDGYPSPVTVSGSAYVMCIRP